MISDLAIRTLSPNARPNGALVELFRTDWDVIEGDASPEMAYSQTLFPGEIDAWQRHPEGKVDHFTAPRGQLLLAVHDDRPESPTEGETNSFVIGERNPALVRIPKGVWHGYQALGTEPAMVLDFPSEPYDYYDPDRETKPADTDDIPFEWE
jgi:dTDP-4-dehydrorhamnose 3,5-epimerase